MAVIAIYNQKGGVGKTTSALNLTAALWREGYHPLLIDLDPQCHLTSIHMKNAPIEPEAGMCGFFRDDLPLAPMIRPWERMGSFLPAHQDMSRLDQQIGKGPTAIMKLMEGLKTINHPGPVILDCCPYLGVISLNALFACDFLLIPVTPDTMAFRGAQQVDRVLRALEPVQKRFGKEVKRRYVLTRFNHQHRRLGYAIHDQMLELMGDDLCSAKISHNIDVAESPEYHASVFDHKPSSRGVTEYQLLLDEIRDLAGIAAPAGHTTEARA